MNKPRPKHLDLTKIKLPLPALVSILHRVSGAALFLFLPLLLWLWHASIESPETFAAIGTVLANPFMKLVLLGLLWGYVHHVCAGIRHLALDLHVGGELAAARASSVAVMVVSIAVTLIAGVALW